MKILVATTIEPFVPGGADRIVDWLETMLLRRGHEVETFRFPFQPDYRYMPDQMLALRLFDLSDRGDRLIAVRTPSYLLRHPNKVLWFIHHHRGAYDLWGTPYGDLPDTPEARRCRAAIRSADQLAFGEARRIFANSQVVARRLWNYNQVRAQVLYPPLLDPEQYRSGPCGDYILYVSRMVPHKRQHLAIEALAHARTRVRLVLAGSADAAYLRHLHETAAQRGVAERVEMLSGWISDERKLDLLENCLAAVYTPFDEDSYGFAALEVQQAAKPVIATSDSGGPLELVLDGENGLICPPDAACLGAAMDRMYNNRDDAAAMGRAGQSRIAAMGITWDRVLESLLA